MSNTLSQAGLERLHAAMAERVAAHTLPGAVVLVGTLEDAHVEVFGTTAFESEVPMRRETPFRIASLTKPVLAVATLMLAEEGVLGLEDPVNRWLPELADRRVLKRIDGPLDETVPAHRPITIDDLLTSRMGFGILTEPTFDPPFPIVEAGNALGLALGQPDPPTSHSPDEWMRRFGTLPLMYQPGERWLYNAPFSVLGVLVARAADQSLGDVFASRVFEPLGMRHTGFSLPLDITRHLPSYYMTNFQTGQLERRDVSTPEQWSRPPAFPSGAGGLVSTVDDYLAFARVLLNEGAPLLSQGSLARMTSNHLTPEQIAGGGPILNGQGWGFGVCVRTAPDANWPVPGRYGWAGGYGTAWFNDPHRGIVAIAMTQVSDFLWNGGVAEFENLVGAMQ
ncbi:MAG: beta-lactamase family protein [Chloroflexi bacterium]|nr:beta-lactamase family protein [Chloroflexota bacterium]